jgi:hypothetical protein
MIGSSAFEKGRLNGTDLGELLKPSEVQQGAFHQTTVSLVEIRPLVDRITKKSASNIALQSICFSKGFRRIEGQIFRNC